MKKLITILVMLVAMSASAQWVWQNPLPQGNDLNDVSFINSQTGWFVGNYGTVMKTDNAGMNYTYTQLNYNHNYINVNFFNNIGYIGGNSRENLNSFGLIILKTTDSGNNWTTISNSAVDVYRKLYFINQNTGWLLKSASSTSYSKLFKTINGGNSWDSTIFSGINLVNFYLLNDLTGWIGGSNRMLKTTDGGNNWISYTNNFDINTLYFADINVGFAGNTFGGIYKTTNSGQNWSMLNTIQYFNIRDIYFQNANTGLAIGRHRNIMRTTNSGLNWVLLEFDSVYSFNSLLDYGNVFNRIINVNGTGFAVGAFGEIRKSTSADFGASWDKVTKFAKTDFYQMRFLNNTTGFVTGSGLFKFENAVLKTTNAGDVWTKAFDNPDTSYFNSSYFVNESTGWVAGQNLYRTTNGGANWQLQLQSNGTSQSYQSPYFINALTGFVSNQNVYPGNIATASLLKTTDGGLNWNTTSLGGRGFSKMKFVNDNEAWIIVNQGSGTSNSNNIYKTSNGGNNWTLVTRPSGSVKDIDLINSNTGWSCQDSSVSFSTNGGQNWSTILSGTNFKFVKFININTGFVISSTNIYKTVNGGTTWNTKSLQGMNISSNNAYFMNENTGWILGDNGTIIKTTNSGNVFVSHTSTETPTKFSLSQNYPNPFNPTTKIKFDIPTLSFPHVSSGNPVILKVFDITGREIQILVNERLQPGTYETTFNGHGLTSGIYFYQLRAGEFIDTKKLILLK